MYLLRLDCTDQPGIVAAVSNCLAQNSCNIEESSQFNDVFSGRFFMRTLFSSPGHINTFKSDFSSIAKALNMNWAVSKQSDKIPTLILVSQADHCLNDILYRWRTGHLNIDIRAVASNHESNRKLTQEHGIRYEYLPVTPDTKSEQEAKLETLIEETGAELIVLARYMQVLSDGMSAKYAGRIINIHHSFLPGFKGAKPYHQAWERGVKIMGATAHFVTADLDEGPIIDQETVRIHHALTPDKMQILGKDNESCVLSRAIQAYAERRIFLHGNRTVIL